MKRKIFKNFRALLMISLFGFLFFTLTQSAQAGTTPATVTASGTPFSTLYFTPQIEIPNSGISGKTALGSVNASGVVVSNLLGIYISAIYKYGLSVAGILAAIVMMAGGVMWLTSGGDSGQVSKAKSFIGGSLTGLFLLFGTYIILNTVSPDLVAMKDIPTIVPTVDLEQYETIICCYNEYTPESFEVYEQKGKLFLRGGKEFPGCDAKGYGGRVKKYEQCKPNEQCIGFKTLQDGTKTDNYCVGDDTIVCCTCVNISKANSCYENITRAKCFENCSAMGSGYNPVYQTKSSGVYTCTNPMIGDLRCRK